MRVAFLGHAASWRHMKWFNYSVIEGFIEGECATMGIKCQTAMVPQGEFCSLKVSCRGWVAVIHIYLLHDTTLYIHIHIFTRVYKHFRALTELCGGALTGVGLQPRGFGRGSVGGWCNGQRCVRMSNSLPDTCCGVKA